MTLHERRAAWDAATLPSKLFSLAIDDMQDLLDNPEYELDSMNFHYPSGPDGGNKRYCMVCLAGSSMVRRLAAPLTKKLFPTDFEPVDTGKLVAINNIRAGCIGVAVNNLTRRGVLSPAGPHRGRALLLEETQTFATLAWDREQAREVIGRLRERAAILKPAGL